MATTKAILISSAGLASLLLTQSLCLLGISFLIFERDDSLVFHAEGYRLSLLPKGLDAIESVLNPPTRGKFLVQIQQN